MNIMQTFTQYKLHMTRHWNKAVNHAHIMSTCIYITVGCLSPITGLKIVRYYIERLSDKHLTLTL